MRNHAFVKIWAIVYEGETDAETQETTETGKPETATTGNAEGTKETKQEKVAKTFTQEDVNRIVETEKKKLTANRQNLLNELKTLRETANLTQEQKDQLEARIEQVQTETMTAQELAKKERDKIVKESATELKKAMDKTTYWQTKYSTEKIERELKDAAIEGDGIDPTGSQIADLLRPKTKLVEELKDGKPTGEWLPKVSVKDVKEDGTVVILDLSPTEAIKRMKEDSKNHWNLFKSNVNGGLGNFNVPNQSSFRGKEPPTDPASFRKWAVENNIMRK